MPPFYPYTSPESPKNWPKIILITIGVIILIGTGYLLINTYISGKRGDNNNNSAGSLGDNTYSCSSDVYNCANFTIQAEAQIVFDYCEQQGAGDIHNLDADGNGKACESLA